MLGPLKHGTTGDNEKDDYKPFIQEGKPSTGVPKFKNRAGKGRKTRRSRRSKRKTNRRFRK